MVLGNCFWVEEAVDESEAPDLSGRTVFSGEAARPGAFAGKAAPGGLRGAVPACGARPPRGGREAEAGPESLRGCSAAVEPGGHLAGISSRPGEVRCPGSAVRRVTTFRAGTPASEQEPVLGYTGCARGHRGSLETGRRVNRAPLATPGPRAGSGGGAEHRCPRPVRSSSLHPALWRLCLQQSLDRVGAMVTDAIETDEHAPRRSHGNTSNGLAVSPRQREGPAPATRP
ncbi:unnamed protein product [Rangifer tarandus platyrhynchus]|uniref:Uncharacterized protein n=1 Tax=Rangifer tarandus platyrhynchus TaxID=3082113 RepID=A0AC60A2L0_RANTA